ncbi:MAG: phasin family protein [Bosea sp. (in: a-proteobacteria)]|nr:phasin family protein [Bosea sp. (in: a-proteobacteria)]
MPAAKVEEGIEIVKAQFASATVLPQKIWETQFALAAEILTFMGRRMQAQAEFCTKLGRCTEFGEAIGVQQDFARGVGGAYADEAGKLSTLARKNMDAWTGASAQYVSNLTALQKKAA